MKRITALMLALVISLVLTAPCMAAADTLKDIESSGYKTEIETLYSLNLVKGDENKKFNPYNDISRIEFLAMLFRLIGQESAAQASASETLPFTDVPVDHWGRGYVCLAYKWGIINGMSENEFGIGQTVTYNQAIKMLVGVMGYSIAAERLGGWPQGFVAQAMKLQLTDGVGQNERNLTRQEAARLIVNALDVQMLEYLNGEYTQRETPLELLGYTKLRGVVTNTFEVQTNAQLLEENTVEISGVRYETSYFVGAELFGAHVTFYTEKDSDREIIRYVVKRRDADFLEVAAENILPSTTVSEFVYEENGRTRKEKLIGASLNVIYNGRPLSSADIGTGQVLNPRAGKVALRDLDEDGTYDTAVVTEYVTMVASSITENNILDKYGNSIELDMDKEQILVYKNNVPAELTDIKNGDILSAALSKDNEKLTVHISNDSFEGTVKELSNDNGKTVYGIFVDGETKEYTLAYEYREAQRLGRSVAAKFDLGDSGVFYTSYTGEIAFATLTQRGKDTTYGYILANAAATGINTGGQIKMLTLDNKFTVFELQKELYFGRMSGGSYQRTREKASTVISALSHQADQLCAYKLDKEGKISELQLAAETNAGNANSEYLWCSVDTQTMNYTQNLLNQKYIVDENTAVFYIPNSGEYEDILAAGKYNKFLRNGKVIVTTYDIKNNHVGALVYSPLSIERYDNGIGEYETIIDNVNSPVLYIQSVTYKAADDGNSYMCLTGIEDGEVVEIKVADELSGVSQPHSLLKAGVAIQYEMNDITRGRAETSDEEELLIVFKVVYDFNNADPNANSNGDSQTYNYTTSVQVRPQISVIHSRLTAVEPGFLAVRYGSKAAATSGGTVYMSYDRNLKERFKIISPEQMAIDQEIVLRLRYLNTREAVVIE